MKILRQILFLMALTAGLSLAVAAQKNDDQKKPPPKPDPPVINPQPDKKPPKDSPKQDKPKKPAYALVVYKNTDEIELA